MQRRAIIALTLGAAVVSAAPAQAQIGVYNRPVVNPRPTVSPYLNIFRGGSGAINYYGVVRPQLEMNRQLYQLQQEVQQTTPGVVFPMDPQAQGVVSTTGHPVSFQNYAHFYGGRGGSSGVAGGTGIPLGRPNFGAAPIRPVLSGVVIQN
jgi:hypothetical protein